MGSISSGHQLPLCVWGGEGTRRHSQMLVSETPTRVQKETGGCFPSGEQTQVFLVYPTRRTKWWVGTMPNFSENVRGSLLIGLRVINVCVKYKKWNKKKNIEKNSRKKMVKFLKMHVLCIWCSFSWCLFLSQWEASQAGVNCIHCVNLIRGPEDLLKVYVGWW